MQLSAGDSFLMASRLPAPEQMEFFMTAQNEQVTIKTEIENRVNDRFDSIANKRGYWKSGSTRQSGIETAVNEAVIALCEVVNDKSQDSQDYDYPSCISWLCSQGESMINEVLTRAVNRGIDRSLHRTDRGKTKVRLEAASSLADGSTLDPSEVAYTQELKERFINQIAKLPPELLEILCILKNSDYPLTDMKQLAAKNGIPYSTFSDRSKKLFSKLSSFVEIERSSRMRKDESNA